MMAVFNRFFTVRACQDKSGFVVVLTALQKRQITQISDAVTEGRQSPFIPYQYGYFHFTVPFCELSLRRVRMTLIGV